MPINGYKNSDVNSGEKGSNGEKVHEIHFRLDIDLHFYSYAPCALLEDFEIFNNYKQIFTIEFLSTPQSGYDPVGPSNLINNTSISPTKHS